MAFKIRPVPFDDISRAHRSTRRQAEWTLTSPSFERSQMNMGSKWWIRWGLLAWSAIFQVTPEMVEFYRTHITNCLLVNWRFKSWLPTGPLTCQPALFKNLTDFNLHKQHAVIYQNKNSTIKGLGLLPNSTPYCGTMQVHT